MLRIALFSPSKNPYSETFVQAHKNLLKDTVFYFYGSGSSTQLEGYGPLVSRAGLIKLKLQAKLQSKPVTFAKHQPIVNALKKHKIDVVLAEYGIHAHNILPIVKQANLPLVVHFHGYDASVPAAIEKCDNYKELFGYANSVVVVSKKMSEMLQTLGCPPDKLVCNPCGPQPIFETVVPSFSKKQFIALGRFVDKKAPYYTLLAFRETLKEHPDAHLIMGGNGPLLNACKNLAAHYKLNGNVSFPGIISQDTFLTYLRDSIAFVQHSVRADNGDMEGSPVSIVEAGLAGLPVIATRHAGIPDIIIHKESGFLCEEHDVRKMATYMNRLLDQPELAKTMGAYNRERVRENFSLQQHIELLQATLEEAHQIKVQ